MSLRYIIFGSPSSLDKDIFVVVPNLPNTIQDCKLVVDGFEETLQKEYTQKVNVNIGTLENGTITKVFKGTPDEVNNSIFCTSAHHENKEHFVTKLVDRDIERKVLRGLRIMLSLLSRTSHRTLVKGAFKGDIYQKIDVLDILMLSEIKDLGKTNMTYPDYLKTMSFQIGQVLALTLGVELYTKEEIGEYFPGLKPYLQRNVEADLETLQKAKTSLIQQVRNLNFKHLYEY